MHHRFDKEAGKKHFGRKLRMDRILPTHSSAKIRIFMLDFFTVGQTVIYNILYFFRLLCKRLRQRSSLFVLIYFSYVLITNHESLFSFRCGY